MMDHPDRGPQVFAFMSTVKWMLGTTLVVIVISFILTVASVGDSRKQTLDALAEMRKQNEALAKQVDLLKQENHWSIQDRADLHETQGAIREALKRMEAKR